MRRVFDFLENHNKKGVYSFHMPGHKGNRDFLPECLFSFDITEIPGADNLNMPSGIISDMQKQMSQIFSADESHLLVNGSSSGNLAALFYAVQDGGKVIIARNAHRSAFSALSLSGAEPVYVMPEMTEYGFAGGVSPLKIKKALNENENVSAVFLTSPTFEGYVSDIAEIARIVHASGKLLIVDEAHGPHFAFSDYFPKSAVVCGADIVVQSLHKTLPVMGQVSALHIKGSRVDRAKLKHYISFVQTSSPSYILMAQADFCLDKLINEKTIFERYTAILEDFREKASKLSLKLYGMENKASIFDYDRGKLVFSTTGLTNETRLTLESDFRDNFGISLEMSGLRHFIAMSSPADVQEGFDRLLHAVSGLNTHQADNLPAENLLAENPLVAVSPKAAFQSKAKRVSFKDAVGQIVTDFVIPYPPGIPLLAPGEIFTKDIFEKIKTCVNSNINIIGGTHLRSGEINIMDMS